MPSESMKNCHLASGVCCASTCQVGGVKQCSGHHCSDAGSSSQCCGGPIVTEGVDCSIEITNAPCVLNQGTHTTTGTKVLCSQDCYDASLGRQRCGGGGCGGLPGQSAECCVNTIYGSGKLCEGDALNAPCVLP